MNLQTKLARLEVAIDRLMDTYDSGNDSEAAAKFHTTMEKDSELMDNVNSKVSKLMTLEDVKGKSLRLAKHKT